MIKLQKNTILLLLQFIPGWYFFLLQNYSTKLKSPKTNHFTKPFALKKKQKEKQAFKMIENVKDEEITA